MEISTPPMSAGDSAKLLNVDRHTVQSAKTILHEGTPEEIEAVQTGKAAVSTTAKQIRKGRPKAKPKKKRDQKLSETGKNPERIQSKSCHPTLTDLDITKD